MARILRWFMVACFLFMFATATAWKVNGRLKFLIDPHKAVGFVLMALAVLRFIWMLQKARPANAWIAKAGHLALCALMPTVPALAIARQTGLDLPCPHRQAYRHGGRTPLARRKLVATHPGTLKT